MKSEKKQDLLTENYSLSKKQGLIIAAEIKMSNLVFNL